jgi:hypothetical protein
MRLLWPTEVLPIRLRVHPDAEHWREQVEYEARALNMQIRRCVFHVMDASAHWSVADGLIVHIEVKDGAPAQTVFRRISNGGVDLSPVYLPSKLGQDADCVVARELHSLLGLPPTAKTKWQLPEPQRGLLQSMYRLCRR